MIKSALRLCTKTDFEKEIASIVSKNSVNYPWTAKETVKSASAFTEKVYDCTANGLALPGDSVVLSHICPTEENIKSFETVKTTILKKLESMSGSKESLHSLLIGGTRSNESLRTFDMFENFMTKENISYSKLHLLKSANIEGTNLAYKALCDKFLVTNQSISDQVFNKRAKLAEMSKSQVQKELKGILKRAFEDVEVSRLDLLI